MLEFLGHFHPIAVHFPLALLIVGGMFSLSARLVRQGEIRNALQAAGAWNFSLGVLSLVPAVLTGWAAYQTVAHDAPSHAAMTFHRNWALAAFAVCVGVALMAWRKRGRSWPSSWVAWAGLLLGLGLIGVTGFLGGKLVYRYGLGVQSLPLPERDGHPHSGGGHHGEPMSSEEVTPPHPADSPAKGSSTPHSHDGKPHHH